jgi:hypothetical protein
MVMGLPDVTLFYWRIESGDRREPLFSRCRALFCALYPPSTDIHAKVDAGGRLTPPALGVND